MKVEPTKLFLKQFLKCPVEVQNDVSRLLEEIAISDSLVAINHIKKLNGYKNYYRYKKGSWRVGLIMENNTMIICIVQTIGPRGDFYKPFPPK